MTDYPEKEALPKEEFRAHSTFKTNERLHGWFIVADEAHKKAYMQPQLASITDYAATLDVLWKNVFMVFNKDENIKLKEYWDAYKKIKPATDADCVAMFNNLRMIDYLIRNYLQNPRKYFFKLETVDSKGIEEAIKSAQLGNGVFSSGRKK